MQENTKKLIKRAIREIIEKSDNKIEKLLKKHRKKLHFIPSKYRVLGGDFTKYEYTIWKFYRNFNAKLSKK